MESPFFIVGMPRSGTTLVSSMLNSHQNISVLSETHYFRITKHDSSLKKSLFEDQNLQSFFNHPQILISDISQKETALIKNKLREKRINRQSLFNAILVTRSKCTNKQFIGEKTPGHIFFMEDIKKIYPQAKIIFMLRDPRDVALSLSKVNWHIGGFYKYAQDWVHALKAYEGIEDDRKYLIRYEDLIENPSSEMQKVFKFLGLPYDSIVLDYYKKTPNFSLENEPWKRKNLKKIDDTNKEKWRKELGIGKIKLVENISDTYMEKYNYRKANSSISEFYLIQLLITAKLRYYSDRLVHKIRRVFEKNSTR